MKENDRDIAVATSDKREEMPIMRKQFLHRQESDGLEAPLEFVVVFQGRIIATKTPFVFMMDEYPSLLKGIDRPQECLYVIIDFHNYGDCMIIS